MNKVTVNLNAFCTFVEDEIGSCEEQHGYHSAVALAYIQRNPSPDEESVAITSHMWKVP